MNRINGYGAYQNSYHTNTVNKKDAAKTSKTGTSKTDGTKKTDSSVQLSDRAKALLKELQKTYSNMDFMVADYETDEEAASYLSRGSKEYSVLIDPEELERMAADEDVKEQNLSILDEAVDKLDDMTRQLGDSKDDVIRMGISIGKDGEVSYFAELEKAGERRREFVEKIRNNKKEAAGKADSKTNGKYDYEHSKHTTLYASSAEELLDKIKNVNWDEIKEETTVPTPGGRFDYTI